MFAHPCFSFILVACTLSRKQIQANCKLWQYQCKLRKCRLYPQHLQKKMHFPTWFQIYCRIGWHLTSDDSWNALRLCQGRTLIRSTWKNCFLLSGNVCEIIDENAKDLHICDWTVTDTVTKYMFNHHKWISRMNSCAGTTVGQGQ